MIDLWKLSREWLTDVGDEASRPFYMNTAPGEYLGAPQGQSDNSHLKYTGAMLYAGMIARELTKLGEPYSLLVENEQVLAETKQIEVNG